MFNRNTDREWEKFGANDPYYGVLTHEKFHKANLTDENKKYIDGLKYIQLLDHWRFAAVGAVKGEPPLQFNDLGFLCEDQLRRLIGPAANHLQDLFATALQLAHNASRKSLRSG